MANGYTTMYDILKNSLVERRERYGTTEISHIIIDGNKFGGYKTFSSFWEKTYVKSPERSTNGVIGNLNSYTTFVTFHLTVNFAMMSIDDYRRLYDLMLDRNEFTVTAYNILTNKPYTCKMYFAPDQMPKLYTMARRLQGEKFIEVLGVQDYTIELIGTNASMDKVEIRYYDNNGSLISEATQSVDKGVETVVNYNFNAPVGYRFDGEWRKENGGVVKNGEVITPLDNTKLTAVLVPTDQYTLSLDYGVGLKPIPQSTNNQVDNFTIRYGEALGTAISNANITLSSGVKFAFPSSGTGVADVKYNNKTYSGSSAYLFSGWFWSTEANASSQVVSTTKYNDLSNKTIHQIYTPKSYSINFTTNDTAITLSSMTAKYNDKVALPKLNVSGKTFKGWYWKDGDTEFAFNGIMPPFELNLYAKWE